MTYLVIENSLTHDFGKETTQTLAQDFEILATYLHTYLVLVSN